MKCAWDGSRSYDKTLGLRDVRNTCSALRQMVMVRTRVDGQSRTVVKSRKVVRAVGVGRMKRISPWDEGVSSRIQDRKLRGGITAAEEGGRGRGRRTFPYRKRNGGHFSRRGHPFPVHDHHEIQTKMADSGRRRGWDGQGVREIRSERGKWERRKSSAERQRGP